ncbi:MAG: acetoin utilization protein AcuC, partial [Exiguobacterium sp.]|nr:acetoin utilization protein AcuC [Exiguobacterium sp.]
LREACEWFKPDIILTQNGADVHVFDPLTHLASTIRTFEQIPQIASRLADEYTDDRLVALGGGGYDWYRAVPRAWAQVWAGLTREAPYSGDIPREWIEQWSGVAGQPLPTRWDDSLYAFDHIPRRQQIEEKNWEVTKRAFWPFISNDRKSIYL